MSEHYLKVNNAEICYEIDGSGPFIVCVPGGNGGAKIFRRFRDLLVKHFTVVLYDRRGYFRSQFTGPLDHANRITTDVDDLYQLMTHLTNEKFIIFGVSASGALLMKYIETYPETISKMFAHEPMLFVDNFKGIDKHLQDHHHLLKVLTTEGKNGSLDILGQKYLNRLDWSILVDGQRHEKFNHWNYWIEHESKQYPFAKLDWDTIKTRKNILVILYGIDSVGFLITELVAGIAKRLDKETFPLPGGHVGFYSHHKAFTTEFIEICKARSLFLKPSPTSEPSPFSDPLLLDRSKL
ncbi:hypothetical protein MFLAVUS_000443 [Mucor flavus]|uniref:AB hydrolase-1 domain-containing protein n=1 Tax=Mucor flavus TaxID=439312 RepID=A0ABP9YJR8_9FUNG